MKRFAILGVLVILGGSLFTGCQTTVPHDNNATTTSTSRTYSK